MEEEEADAGEFEFQGRRNLRFHQRRRAIIFSGEIKDFTATSMAAAKLMRGKLRETRMTRNGELLVEVDDDEDVSVLSRVQSLGGVAVTPRESKPRVISKGMLFGVHRSISEPVIVESLKRVGVTEASRVKARDSRLGAMVNTDRVLLTFADGSSIPEQVCLGLNLHAVVAYYEPLQCYKCNVFGHVSKNCQEQSEACRRCSERGHIARDCKGNERCANCSGPHSSKFGACPVRIGILERWKRSTLPSGKPGVQDVPIVVSAPGVNAHEDFRSGRSYAGAVRNGIRVAQSAPLSTSTNVPAQSNLNLLAPTQDPIACKPAPTLDIEALTAQVMDSVLEAVIPRLSALIDESVTRILGRVLESAVVGAVEDSLAKALPKFMEKIITTLRPSSHAAAIPAAPVFDINAVLRDASSSSSRSSPGPHA